MNESAELTEAEFCRQYDPNMYQRPSLTTDVLVLTFREGQIQVLLIERKNHPFRGYWATPGGFIEFGEPPEICARRELEEETGVRAPWLKTLGAYGAPERDPRTHIVSIVYFTALPAARLKPRAGDDAAKARWFNLYRLPQLGLDHNLVCADMRRRLRVEFLDLTFAEKLLGRGGEREDDLLALYRIVYGKTFARRQLRALTQVFRGQRGKFPANIIASLR